MAETDVLVQGLLVVVINPNVATDDLNVSDSSGGACSNINTSMTRAAGGHIDLDIGQVTSLGCSPVEGCDYG